MLQYELAVFLVLYKYLLEIPPKILANLQAKI